MAFTHQMTEDGDILMTDDGDIQGECCCGGEPACEGCSGTVDILVSGITGTCTPGGDCTNGNINWTGITEGPDCVWSRTQGFTGPSYLGAFLTCDLNNAKWLLEIQIGNDVDWCSVYFEKANTGIGSHTGTYTHVLSSGGCAGTPSATVS